MLALSTYTFLDPVIWKGFRSSKLSVDELPSPFPLPLTAPASAPTPAVTVGPNGRKRAKNADRANLAVGQLGKACSLIDQSKPSDIEADLGAIRRGNKRRRAGQGKP